MHENVDVAMKNYKTWENGVPIKTACSQPSSQNLQETLTRKYEQKGVVETVIGHLGRGTRNWSGDQRDTPA